MLHRCAALTAVLATGALAATSALAAGPAVTGDGFTTTLPDGWTSHDYASQGGHAWGFASPGATVSKLATPSPGGIGVTAWTASAASVERRLGRLSSNPVRLMQRVTGVPKGARHLHVISKPRATTWAGMRAGAMTLSYTYKKRRIVQRDVAARRGGRMYEIELDVDRKNAAAGRAALQAILAAWTFSG
jgi:hypothetical protein